MKQLLFRQSNADDLLGGSVRLSAMGFIHTWWRRVFLTLPRQAEATPIQPAIRQLIDGAAQHPADPGANASRDRVTATIKKPRPTIPSIGLYRQSTSPE